MGLFDLFKKKKMTGLEYAQMLEGSIPIFSQFGKNIYASDVVQQAVSCVVNEMKKLDMQHIVQKGADVIPQYDRIQSVLEDPNPLMTGSDFIEKIIWQLMLTYNSFACPVWDKNGELEAIYPIQPHTVEFLKDSHDTIYIKMWFGNDYVCTVKYNDIIHIRYQYSSNEFMGGDKNGEPNHDGLLKTLELNQTMLEGVAKALKTSFAINGVIKLNSMLDPEKAEKSVKELTDALKRNESGLLAMDLKGEFIPFQRQIALVDTATLKFIDEKILRHFGVSLPILTGDYTKEQYEAFYQKTLEPLIKSISQAFSKALFSKRESFGFGHKIKFYPKDLIFLNTTQKLEMLRLLGDSGALFENEKRVLMGLKPLEELVGVRKQSLNYVDVEIANQYQTGKKEEEPEEEEPKKEESAEGEQTEEEVEENDKEEVQSE